VKNGGRREAHTNHTGLGREFVELRSGDPWVNALDHLISGSFAETKKKVRFKDIVASLKKGVTFSVIAAGSTYFLSRP
jgi:hypothetical protein